MKAGLTVNEILFTPWEWDEGEEQIVFENWALSMKYIFSKKYLIYLLSFSLDDLGSRLCSLLDSFYAREDVSEETHQH